MIGIGIIGLGNVFEGPYRTELAPLIRDGHVTVHAVYDHGAEKRAFAAAQYGISADLASPDDVIGHPDVEIVLILASMPAHGGLAEQALAAGKHVLVEKPMATDLVTAARLVEAAKTSPGHLVPAPHVILSPTYRSIHADLAAGRIGRPTLARALYGWSGPDWGQWFYQSGGGSLFDLGVYNVVSLCGLLGSAMRVTGMVGTAIPERVVEGEPMAVAADDNAHVLIDFGNACYAVVTTGFTIQKYRTPAIELYGLEGTMQMMGDDWAPDGYEVWENATSAWTVHPETKPSWRWTAGLAHLVEAIETDREPLIRPEHGYHALEIMLAAQESGRTGTAVDITSAFPAVSYEAWPDVARDQRARHDPGSA
jgi:predicted dehydrogenase